MEILLTIALFVAFFWLLRQEKALGKYAQSTILFTQAVDQYQEAVEGYQEAIAKYQQAIELYEQDLAGCELLLKEHGIDKSKPKGEPIRQLVPPPPPQFTLPDLKTTKRQASKPKGVSKNSPMYKEFLNLLNGNEETANRLITRQQQLNPDRLDNWILEKVIGDLKRDRRA
ncbi:hypothetical protein CDG76_30660 [Nostoc sp. 'Peltigera membranacea cyanobiont' 210A]|uniref:hypothetical protein n=1 Tax=Nostoc sp. 'Peltigera membranacea cyanobiont' 210A TaxID=2014529 RepID=UPI000B956E88|nr:hypothetical protein [Nostoc sp. 'Peltigera membranacea cyanobiont' 210A]OYD90588.1 hypothetical protein CDG76_30660 [Nostoc sp. 'Peltigera membranacea cyanobiont' 210A]